MTKRKPKNTSKIEVIAHKDEIEELLFAGHNYMQVFKKLQEQNKISCKYHAFLNSLKNICEITKNSNKPKYNKHKLKENTQEKSENVQQSKRVPSIGEQPPKINHRPDLDEKKDFINHDYDPIGGESTENKKEEENKGDNK